MIFFSIGVPGPFSKWCDAVIGRLIEHAFGPVEQAWAQTPEDVALDLVRLEATHLVIASRRPGGRLRALLAETRPQMIVSLDDPRAVLRELVAAHAGDFRAATAEAARSCAAAYICAELAHARSVRVARGQDAAANLIAPLADSLGIAVDPSGIAKLLDGLPYPYSAESKNELDAWWSGLDPAQLALGGGALGAYIVNFREGGFREIVWDRALFWRNGRRDLPADEAIELGEPNRVLVGGPNIELPAGQWHATVTLGTSKEAGSVGFDVAVVGSEPPEVLAQGRIVPDFRGVGTTTLAFAVTAVCGRSIGVTVTNVAAAPGGRVAIGNVTLAPYTADASDIPTELTAVLGR